MVHSFNRCWIPLTSRTRQGRDPIGGFRVPGLQSSVFSPRKSHDARCTATMRTTTALLRIGGNEVSKSTIMYESRSESMRMQSMTAKRTVGCHNSKGLPWVPQPIVRSTLLGTLMQSIYRALYSRSIRVKNTDLYTCMKHAREG